MARWNPVNLLLLCCVYWYLRCLAHGCSLQGPENCTFETNVNWISKTADYTWCSWRPDENWEHFWYPSFFFPVLSKTKLTGTLASRNSCSTEGQEFCFFFRYLFDVANEIDLTAYIQNITSPQSEITAVWSASNAGFLSTFQEAYFPITTHFDYAVVFNASRRSETIMYFKETVSVDDVQLVQSPCPTCFAEGPENCTFQRDFGNASSQGLFTPCSWNSSGGWLGYLAAGNWYVGLRRDETFAQLTSRPACSTKGQTHCLMFDYTFSEGDTVNLTVLVQNIKNRDSKTTLWSASRVPIENMWEHTSVSVRTDYDFVVIFEATRLSNESLQSDISAYIDSITYGRSPCASPVPEVYTPTLPTLITTVTFPQTSFGTSPATTTQTSPVATPNVPLIAGLTAAAVAVTIIAVSVIVVLRKRRHQFNSSKPTAKHPVAFSELQFSNVSVNIEDNSAPVTPIAPANISEANVRNLHRNSQTYPKAIFTATNVESSPPNRDNRDDRTNTFPNVPSTRETGDDGNSVANATGDNVALFPSEMYCALSVAGQEHGYARFNVNAQARGGSREDVGGAAEI